MTPEESAARAVRCAVEYANANPTDPDVIALRAAFADLGEAVEAYHNP